MAYGVLKVGKTGPSGRIGRGSDWHIDAKYSRGTSWEDIVGRFDAKAGAYKKDGRNIVFSNEGVANTVYDPSASLEDKVSLLKKVDGAHSHSVSPDFYSFDFYAPVGTDIWDKSAEGAPIYLAGTPGRKAAGGRGGGYGNFAYVMDTDGNVIGKTGHGDTDEDIFAGGTFEIPTIGDSDSLSPGGTDTPSVVDADVSPQVEAKERAQEYTKMSKSELDSAYDVLRESDPEEAEIEGMKMHKAFFGK